jgi:hypothetical protein
MIMMMMMIDVCCDGVQVVTVFSWWEKPRDAWSAANYACEVLVVAQTH